MDNSPIKKLSVVVPCFNEEANLNRYPDELFATLSTIFPEWEVILVDDGSTDQTYKVMQGLQGKYPQLVLCQHLQNEGLGSSIRTGLRAASGDAFLTLDGDLTFHPREIPQLLKAYSQDVDCVMGSPFQGKMEGVHPLRHFLSWGVNSVYALLLGQSFSSVSSIFRLMRSHKLKALNLTSTSFDINAEILFKLIQLGAKVVEVPVTLGKRIHGVSKINVAREIKNHLKMFVKIVLWKFHLARR